MKSLFPYKYSGSAVKSLTSCPSSLKSQFEMCSQNFRESSHYETFQKFSGSRILNLENVLSENPATD